MKRLFTRSFVVLLALAAFAVAGVSPALARTVRVGIYENEPKVFTGDDGKPAGIFIDILEQIADEQGWTLEYVHGTWEQDLKALQSGKIDLMPDVAYSVARDAKFDFHKTPVVESWSYVYANADVEVDRLSQLDGKRVAVLKGSIQETELRRMADGFGYDIDFVLVDSFAEGFEMTSKGKTDAAVANYLNGDYFFNRYGLVKTPVVFNAVPLYYATAQGKNGDLLRKIDMHLDTWIDEPGSIYYRTLARYTASVPAELMPPYALWTIVAIAALLMLAGGIILLLRWRVEVQTAHLREANAAVEQSKETLRLALDAAEEGIFDWNPHTGEMSWTAKNFEMLGYELDEVPVDLETWTSFVHPDDAEFALRAIWEGITSGDRAFLTEYRMRKKNGDYVWVMSHGKAVELDSDGEVTRVVGTNIDISQRKDSEHRIQRQVARLRALHRVEMAISASATLDAVLNTLLEQAAEQLEVDAASVLLCDGDGEGLEFAAGRGFDSDTIKQAALRMSEGYAGSSVLERRIVHVPNLMEVGEQAEDAGSAEVVSYFGAPLVARGQVKGALEIFHVGELEPDSDWLDFLEMLAEQAAVAIDNAQLLQRLKECMGN